MLALSLKDGISVECQWQATDYPVISTEQHCLYVLHVFLQPFHQTNCILLKARLWFARGWENLAGNLRRSGKEQQYQASLNHVRAINGRLVDMLTQVFWLWRFTFCTKCINWKTLIPCQLCCQAYRMPALKKVGKYPHKFHDDHKSNKAVHTLKSQGQDVPESLFWLLQQSHDQKIFQTHPKRQHCCV